MPLVFSMEEKIFEKIDREIVLEFASSLPDDILKKRQVVSEDYSTEYYEGLLTVLQFFGKNIKELPPQKMEHFITGMAAIVSKILQKRYETE